jgi:hypothetical protein
VGERGKATAEPDGGVRSDQGGWGNGGEWDKVIGRKPTFDGYDRSARCVSLVGNFVMGPVRTLIWTCERS